MFFLPVTERVPVETRVANEIRDIRDYKKKFKGIFQSWTESASGLCGQAGKPLEALFLASQSEGAYFLSECLGRDGAILFYAVKCCEIDAGSRTELRHVLFGSDGLFVLSR